MKDYGKGRKCEHCGQSLNIYNRGPNCHAHSNEGFRVRYVPVTCCTSYNKKMVDKEFGSEGLLPSPGRESYNDMAFNKEIQGGEYDEETDLWVNLDITELDLSED